MSVIVEPVVGNMGSWDVTWTANQGRLAEAERVSRAVAERAAA